MSFTCRKSAFKLLVLFSILPILYLCENGQALNLRHLGAIILIILCCVNGCCNNYKLIITDEEVVLERLIGRTIQVQMNTIRKIELRKVEKDVKLILYARQKTYIFSIRCLEEDKIHAFLNEAALRQQIDYQTNCF